MKGIQLILSPEEKLK